LSTFGKQCPLRERRRRINGCFNVNNASTLLTNVF
jgi:hypothetical protein